MEITPEIRRAVYEADCEQLGHRLTFEDVSRSSETGDGGFVLRLAAQDHYRLPHIRCARCGSVWIVHPVRGVDYDDAERQIYGLLRADTEPAREVTRLRGKREERARKLREQRDQRQPEPPEPESEPVRPPRS
jgi:hypothetical protein